jgi:hypothetical protein
VRSHFNMDTGFDSTVFGMMGNFVGLHALQALIVIARVARRQNWPTDRAVKAITAGAAAIAVACAALAAQALTSRSVTSLSALAIAVAALSAGVLTHRLTRTPTSRSATA